jgi:hypothetical protein
LRARLVDVERGRRRQAVEKLQEGAASPLERVVEGPLGHLYPGHVLKSDNDLPDRVVANDLHGDHPRQEPDPREACPGDPQGDGPFEQLPALGVLVGLGSVNELLNDLFLQLALVVDAIVLRGTLQPPAQARADAPVRVLVLHNGRSVLALLERLTARRIVTVPGPPLSGEKADLPLAFLGSAADDKRT